MTSTTIRRHRKAKSGSVTIRNSNNRLRLVFTYGEKRHFVSLGLSNRPLNRKTAQDKVFEVQRDIEYGEFDPTYQKYKIRSHEPTSGSLIKVAKSGSKLLALWKRAVEYLTPNASPKTINGTYNPVTAHIGRCRQRGW